MSLAEQYYGLNGFKGKLFYNIHELLYMVEHNFLNMRHLRPAFLDAIRCNVLNDNMVGVEIGVEKGKNAFSMFKHLSIKQLYLIDPYINYVDNGRYIRTGDENYNCAKKILDKYLNRCVFIKEKSEDAIGCIPDNVDFVYIDGNHSYFFVKRDVELYSKKLRVGGVLGFDDTGFVSVSRVVLETIDDMGFEPVDGCVNCLRKVK